MTNSLERHQQAANSSCAKHRPKGWSPERRARQAALIRFWQPWRCSTGPKTAAGKKRCGVNALKHGSRSRAAILRYQRIRYALRLAAENLLRIKVFLASRHSRIRYKLLATPKRGEGGPPTCRSCLRDGPFRAVRQGARMTATHLAHAFGEDHRWLSASR